jgi:hypothetical protein
MRGTKSWYISLQSELSLDCVVVVALLVTLDTAVTAPKQKPNVVVFQNKPQFGSDS